VESIEDEFKRISGRSTINVGKAGYRIHLYGSDMPEITSQPIQDRWNNQHAAVLNEIYELTQEINGLNAASDKGKAAKAAELGTRMLGLLEQLYRLRTGDAFNNTVNQFSVGIEAPDGSFTKISLANTKTVISADGGATTETKDALYILNMTSIGFGNSKAVTFTAGIPVSKIGEGELKNLAGVKLNMGDLAFGVAAYDLDFKKGISGARYDFAWVNPSYTKSLVRGAGVGLTQMKGGWSGDLTVGFKIGDDVIASVKVTKTQMKGVLSPAGAVSSQVGQDDINAYSLATDVAINTSTGMTWVLSGAYHHAKQEDLKADQVTARATLADRRGLSGSFYFDTRRFNAPGGNAYDYNVGLTVRKNIF
jgi:hypothetical protein